MTAPNQAYEKPPSFLETIGIFVAIIACIVALAFVVAVITAGAYLGWHELGPWLSHTPGKSS